MEFIDLRKQYKIIQKGLNDRFTEIMEDTRFIMGKEINELESVLSFYVGSKHCITCANGTDALLLALMACNIVEGDAVFVPSFTFFSTAEVVSLMKANPIFVDVDKRTFNIDTEKLEIAIQNVLREGKLIPRAVIAVDLFGLPADYLRIREITEKYNLKLIEDGAQGFGGSLNGKKACSFGDISTTSFFPAKPFGCYGDGGAVFTDHDDIADIIYSLRIHGKGKDKYQNIRVGLNSRLDTLQAAVLLEKIKIFDNELVARNRVAQLYNEGLGSILTTPTIIQADEKQFYSSWAQYSVITSSEEKRDRIIRELNKKDIPTNIYYQKPLHLQDVYTKMQKNYCDLSVSEGISKTILSLPIHPYLERYEVELIVNSIKEIE